MKTRLWVAVTCVAIAVSALALRDRDTNEVHVLLDVPRGKNLKRAKGATHSWPRGRNIPEPIRTPLRAPAATATADEPVLAQLPSDTIFVAAVDHGLDFATSLDANRLLAEYGRELEDVETLTAGIPDFDL